MVISMDSSVPEPLLAAADLPCPTTALDRFEGEPLGLFMLQPPLPEPEQAPASGSELTQGMAGEAAEASIDTEYWLACALQQSEANVRTQPVPVPAVLAAPARAAPLELPSETRNVAMPAAPPAGVALPTCAVAAIPPASLVPVSDGTARAEVSMAPVSAPEQWVAVSSPPLLSSVAAPAPAVSSSAPAPALEARWGERMLQALQDSVHIQLQQKAQHATIRLDPPHMGSLEVSVSHESGRVDVRIHATHVDVARLLVQTSERLRHELTEQNFLHVNVSVGADAQGRQSSRQPARPHAQGVLENETPNPQLAAQRGTAAGSDVLVTV